MKNGVQHVTKAGANIFAELGFPPAEAKELFAQSNTIIKRKLAIKRQLMDELGGWITKHKFTQEQAAAALGVARPRVSDVVRKKDERFSIDCLIGLLARTGKRIEISVQ